MKTFDIVRQKKATDKSDATMHRFGLRFESVWERWRKALNAEAKRLGLGISYDYSP